MDYKLTEDQELIRNMVREFAETEVKPIAAEIDRDSRFPTETVQRLKELNLLGVPFPEQYGGAGADGVSFSIVVEELARACASTGAIVSTHTALGAHPIFQFGTEEQKNKYLIPLASGENLGAFCLTEPAAGTDASAQQTTAVLQGDAYVLNGTKIFITNGGRAQTYIVMAMTDKSQGNKGISAFIVDKGFPGFQVGQLEKQMGINATDTTEIIFKECRVPKQNLLAGEGQGFKIAMNALDFGRVGIGSQALGIAQASLEASVNYAKERHQFGKPLSSFQGLQWMMADMAVRVQAARHLVRHAAWSKDQGLLYSKEAAMAKLYASETAMWTSTKAVQIHGGHGYTKEYPVERFMRDAKITEIYEGTNEVQRMVIANNILK
ncbi:MAG: acyl-CoA dehydrogenase [Pseudomonadota bacterium]